MARFRVPSRFLIRGKPGECVAAGTRAVADIVARQRDADGRQTVDTLRDALRAATEWVRDQRVASDRGAMRTIRTLIREIEKTLRGLEREEQRHRAGQENDRDRGFLAVVAKTGAR